MLLRAVGSYVCRCLNVVSLQYFSKEEEELKKLKKEGDCMNARVLDG